MKQRPRLLRGGLSGRVYVVTKYTESDGQIVAKEKFDVTDDFRELVDELDLEVAGCWDGDDV